MKTGDVRGWEQGLPPPNLTKIQTPLLVLKVNVVDPPIASHNVCLHNVRHKEADFCYSYSTVPGIYGIVSRPSLRAEPMMIHLCYNCYIDYITPSIVFLYNRWFLAVIFSLPGGHKGNYGS